MGHKMFNYLLHLYPKLKIAFDPNDNGESSSGLNSMDTIGYPFFPFVKLDCKQRLNGNGLTPMITLVLLNFLPIPNLPVTIDGNANPASYSKIKLLSLICVLPQRTEVPGKNEEELDQSSRQATPKFHSTKEFFDST